VTDRLTDDQLHFNVELSDVLASCCQYIY